MRANLAVRLTPGERTASFAARPSERRPKIAPIEMTFRIARPADEVWAFLTDPANVASCLPGARLLEVLDERAFLGEVALRLGPFGLLFRGEARYTRLDPAARVAELEATAREERNRGAGRMRMRSRLLEEAAGTKVELEQTLHLSGRLAGFVASALVRQAAEFVLGRFAACVRERLEDPERTEADHTAR